jgi:hypothetical protein
MHTIRYLTLSLQEEDESRSALIPRSLLRVSGYPLLKDRTHPKMVRTFYREDAKDVNVSWAQDQALLIFWRPSRPGRSKVLIPVCPR